MSRMCDLDNCVAILGPSGEGPLQTKPQDHRPLRTGVAILGPSGEGPLRAVSGTRSRTRPCCDPRPLRRGAAALDIPKLRLDNQVAILGPSGEGPLLTINGALVSLFELRSSAPPERGRCLNLDRGHARTRQVAILGPSGEGPLPASPSVSLRRTGSCDPRHLRRGAAAGSASS